MNLNVLQDDLSGGNNNPVPTYNLQLLATPTINPEAVDVYFEADYQTFLNNSSNVNNTLNYVTSLFNVVKLMYENDSINVQISAIKVWNTADPYYFFYNIFQCFNSVLQQYVCRFSG